MTTSAGMAAPYPDTPCPRPRSPPSRPCAWAAPPERLVAARTEDELVALVREADAAGEPLLLLAGGSNVVVADAGFRGTVVRIATRGVERDGGRLTVAAGRAVGPVRRALRRRRPGRDRVPVGHPRVGRRDADPERRRLRAGGQRDGRRASASLDRRSGEVSELPPEACAFSYRSSVFKRDPSRWVVLAVDFALDEDPLSRPIRYAELARTLGVEIGERAPLFDVREAVLELRRRKGMVLDPADPDSVSAGSFFTNPILDADGVRAARGARTDERVPRWPEADGRVKTSAAWLIERAGFTKGYGDPATIAISSKHTLALTNRGAGTTAQLVALAREVAGGVPRAFGVELHPEPVFVGHEW